MCLPLGLGVSASGPAGVCLWVQWVHTPCKHPLGRHPQADTPGTPCPLHAGIHTSPLWIEFLTHAYEHITFAQILLRAVRNELSQVRSRHPPRPRCRHPEDPWAGKLPWTQRQTHPWTQRQTHPPCPHQMTI